MGPREGCRHAEEVPAGVQEGRGRGRPQGDLSVAEVAIDF